MPITARRTAMLEDIRAEIKRHPPSEGYIKEKGWHVSGVCNGSAVVINPLPELIETICHEFLHKLHPRWGEKRVDTEARRLRASMSDAEIRSLYRLYQRIKRPRKTTVNLDDD